MEAFLNELESEELWNKTSPAEKHPKHESGSLSAEFIGDDTWWAARVVDGTQWAASGIKNYEKGCQTAGQLICERCHELAEKLKTSIGNASPNACFTPQNWTKKVPAFDRACVGM